MKHRKTRAELAETLCLYCGKNNNQFALCEGEDKDCNIAYDKYLKE